MIGTYPSPFKMSREINRNNKLIQPVLHFRTPPVLRSSVQAGNSYWMVFLFVLDTVWAWWRFISSRSGGGF